MRKILLILSILTIQTGAIITMPANIFESLNRVLKEKSKLDLIPHMTLEANGEHLLIFKTTNLNTDAEPDITAIEVRLHPKTKQINSIKVTDADQSNMVYDQDILSGEEPDRVRFMRKIQKLLKLLNI